MESSILLGKGTHEVRLSARMANRHGLVAGATGTGKTVTLRVMAEGFSRLGVPVFMADVKGDLSGMAESGGENPKFQDRAREVGVTDYAPRATPVVLWDVFAEQGIAVRATISEMGPLLLARLLNLNETQTGVLNVVFKVAEVEQMLLLDLKDLQSMLDHVSQNAKQYSAAYGNISAASVAAIQRGLLTLEQQGAAQFFGEPALELADLTRTDASGHGVVNILAADKLMAQPKTYATVLLWLLTKLFDELPEVGDLERPKLVFFFDEAHLLFAGAPKVVLEKVEQLVRLIRSKGVGVYFVSQNPLDIPDTVLGQLGNRVQHAAKGLRAARPQGRQGCRPDVSQRWQLRRRASYYRVGGRRSSGLLVGRRRHADAGRAREDRPARKPPWPVDGGRAAASRPIVQAARAVRNAAGSPERLRSAAEAGPKGHPLGQPDVEDRRRVAAARRRRVGRDQHRPLLCLAVGPFAHAGTHRRPPRLSAAIGGFPGCFWRGLPGGTGGSRRPPNCGR